MNTWHAHPAYRIHSPDHHAAGLLQARRRRRLGTVLIVVGAIWHGLRLAGLGGDLLVLAWWVEGIVAVLERASGGGAIVAALPAVCGMLALYKQ